MDKVKLESRRFAKRQLTWFRREKDTIWIEKNEYSYDDNKILNKIAAVNKILWLFCVFNDKIIKMGL